jgi:apolipoprotein N-acyltransferase
MTVRIVLATVVVLEMVVGVVMTLTHPPLHHPLMRMVTLLLLLHLVGQMPTMKVEHLVDLYQKSPVVHRRH